MTSHNCESASAQYSFAGKISVGGEDRVDFIYQFVERYDATKDYANINIYNYLPGKPEIFPKYADVEQTFLMHIYGFDVSISPWKDQIFQCIMPRSVLDMRRLKMTQNFIDIEFHEAVYPIRVSIYEIYNPGNIIEILAENLYENDWFQLWNGSPQNVPLTSRLFSPPLQQCNFKTKKLKLLFKKNIWECYTRIDAVRLIGTSKLIHSRTPQESLTNLLKRIYCMYNSYHEDVYNLTADYKNAHLDIDHLQKNFSKYCTICKSDIGKNYQSNLEHEEISQEVISDCVQLVGQKYSQPSSLTNYAKCVKLSSNESKEPSHYGLSEFPDEIILEILKNLDLITLSRMSQVNKRFNNLTRDPHIYTSLKIRNIFYKKKYSEYISNIFRYFTPRCKYLQQLDLKSSNFSVSEFIQFLENCGEHLTHLRLSDCDSIDNLALNKVSKICKNLKELDLSHCNRIDSTGFECLVVLVGLECLRLGWTSIRTETLCKILRSNQRMRELNLEDAALNLDEVAKELRNSCQDLQAIILFKTYNITAQAINALADCKNLRLVYLYCQCKEDLPSDDSFCRLCSSYQHVTVLAPVCFVHDANTAYFPSECDSWDNYAMRDLYRFEVAAEASNRLSAFFKKCLKSPTFHLMCGNRELYDNMKKQYPHVDICLN